MLLISKMFFKKNTQSLLKDYFCKNGTIVKNISIKYHITWKMGF